MADLSQMSTADLLAAAGPSPETFAAQYAPVAQRAAQQIGVDPQVLLGQWGHETGWGKSVIPGTNNLGNIKDPTGRGPTATDNANGSKDSYASYQSADDFADHYANLIKTQYPGAVGSGNDVQKFTKGLAGYAEDPSYAGHVAAAIKSVPAMAAPSAPASDPATSQAPDLSQMSTADLMAAAGLQQPAQTPASPPPTMTQQVMRQLGLTARDIGHGMADAAGVIGNPLNAAVNTIGGALGHNPGLQDVDTLLKNKIDQYTPQPQGALETGVNNVAEQVANPLNALAGPIAQGGGIARGALAGAVGAGMQPQHAGDTIGNYVGGLATGALTGGAMGALGSAVRGANLSPNVQALMKQGVTPTPGQAMGGYTNTVENMLTSAPITGPAITAGRRAAIADMNRAAYQQVLDPIGAKAPTVVGRQAIEDIGNKISDEYNKILPNLTFQPDAQFYQQIAPISRKMQTLPADAQQAYAGVLQRTLGTQLAQGPVSGTAFKTMDSVIGKEASTYMSSPDAYQRQIGQALQGVQGVMRDTLERTNPNVPTLGPVNQAWKNFAVLRNAGARVNDPDMPIMPGQLQAAVKAGDKSVAKGNFAKGNANMQDLSDAGMSVLGNKYPDSGTAGREALMGQVGATVMHPALAGLLPVQGLGAAAYGTDAGRKAMLAILAQRPDFMRMLGGGMSAVAPQTGAIAANAAVRGQ